MVRKGRGGRRTGHGSKARGLAKLLWGLGAPDDVVGGGPCPLRSLAFASIDSRRRCQTRKPRSSKGREWRCHQDCEGSRVQGPGSRSGGQWPLNHHRWARTTHVKVWQQQACQHSEGPPHQNLSLPSLIIGHWSSSFLLPPSSTNLMPSHLRYRNESCPSPRQLLSSTHGPP